MKIDEVRIKGVRGIRHPIKLDLQGRSLLLHGDNGTGKSSVERALRWALLGEAEPTAEAPFSSESSFRKHLLVDPADPEVQIRFRGGGEIRVAPGEFAADKIGKRIRGACLRSVPFLRRTELLNVLSSRPVERFRYFEAFLGLDQADGLLKDLAETKANQERRATQLDDTLSAEIGALTPLLPQVVGGLAHSVDTLELAALAWAERLGLIAKEMSWEDARHAVARAAQIGGDELDRRRGALSSLASDLDDLRARWNQATPEHPEPIATELEQLEKDVSSTEFDLLRHAHRHFATAEGDVCPVCRQPVDWAKTSADITSRIEALNQLRSLLERRRRCTGDWWARWVDLSKVRSRAEAAQLDADKTRWERLADRPAGLDVLEKATEDLDESARFAALHAIGGKPLESFMTTALDGLRDRVSEAERGLPRREHLPDVTLCSSLFERLDAKRTELRLIAAEFTALRRESVVLVAVYEGLRRARQDVARTTLEKIAERVAQYYLRIHPPEHGDEVTGAPSIDVQRHAGGTAFVRGIFAQQEVKDPRWVYSDGHLDTVGICIFLALRRYRADDKSDERLLVLDDIVISIDLGHARRLLHLLNEEFADHQVFMLTHNGLFAHWCVGLLTNLSLARFEIRGWTLQDGPWIGEHLDAYERLQESLEAGTAKEISQTMMNLLDEWLAEARFELELSVPAKRGEAYTLTDIWEHFANALHGMSKKMKHDLGGAIDRLAELKDVPRIRNYLSAHENEFAREFPRETMVDVARSVLALVAALYCRECRTFARPIPRRSDPSIVHCRCKVIQYVPPGAQPKPEPK